MVEATGSSQVERLHGNLLSLILEILAQPLLLLLCRRRGCVLERDDSIVSHLDLHVHLLLARRDRTVHARVLADCLVT